MENHCIKVYPQFTNIRVSLAEFISARIIVCAGRVRRDDGVGVVSAAATATGDAEDTADTE